MKKVNLQRLVQPPKPSSNSSLLCNLSLMKSLIALNFVAAD